MTSGNQARSMTPDDQLELVKKHYVLNAAGDRPAAQEVLTITPPLHGTRRPRASTDRAPSHFLNGGRNVYA